MDIIEELQAVPWALIAPLIIVQFILMLVALIDCLRHNNTRGPQWIWVLVILFGSLFGPIIYFLFGRRND